MEERMTVQQAVEIVVKRLSGIRVPIGEMDEIGVPILESIRMLNGCLNAWRMEAEKAGEQTEMKLDNEDN